MPLLPFSLVLALAESHGFKLLRIQSNWRVFIHADGRTAAVELINKSVDQRDVTKLKEAFQTPACDANSARQAV